LASSHEEARAVAAQIEQLSKERRSIQDRMIREAVEEIEREGWAERAAIVIGREGWNHGIVGIVAGRLASRFGKPVIVAGFEGGHGRGSVRGPAGSRLHDALTEIASVLERFGGHQAAAGVELKVSKLGEVREAFEAACAKMPSGAGPELESDSLARLLPEDEPDRVLDDLGRLEPCGQGNPTASVAVEAELVSAREVRGGHLKMELELPGGRRVSSFGPSMGGRAAELSGRLLVVGKLRWDSWRGGRAVEIKAERIVG
jgi:single-stranded-DNA-specific exonuclease